ncbi:hypothetical protein ABIE44_001032 [Marmoricola sp. OAE513]
MGWAKNPSTANVINRAVASRCGYTPRRVAEQAAGLMSRATVRTYAGGHFDPYVEPLFSAVVADQLDFVAEHVPTGRA